MRQGSREAVEYESARLRAFELAVGGRTDDALAELNRGWTEAWPFPTAYATDVARVRYLAGDYEDALVALSLAAHGTERVDPAVLELAVQCVRRAPRLWRNGLRIALAGGTASQRADAVWRVARGRLARRV
jgi:hypothetical protein